MFVNEAFFPIAIGMKNQGDYNGNGLYSNQE